MRRRKPILKASTNAESASKAVATPQPARKVSEEAEKAHEPPVPPDSYDTAQRKRAEARAAALAGLGLTLSAVQQPGEAAQVIVDAGLDLFSGDACFLDLYDRPTDTLTPLVNMDTLDGRRTQVLPNVPGNRPTPLLRRILEGKGELLLRRQPEDPVTTVRFGDTTRPSMSLMFVPVRHKGESIGVLSMQSYHPNAYTVQDLEALQGLADHCAGALLRLQTEQALRESEKRFRLMFESHRAIMLLIEPDTGAIVDANGAAAAFYGHSRERLRTMRIQDINQLPEKDVAEQRRKALALDQDRFIFPHSLANGQIRWVEVNSSPVTVHGRPLLFSVIHNITERKEAEERLRLSEEQYRLLFAANPTPMWVFDDETLHFLAVNRAAVLHYGWTEAEFLGMTVMDVRPPETRAATWETIERHRGALEANIGTTRHWRKDGTLRDMDLTFSAITFAGRPARLCMMNDITERKRAEEALIKAKADLERSNRELEQRVSERTARLQQALAEMEHFSYAIIHDMRAPLRAMQGFATLAEEACTGCQRTLSQSYFHRIQTACRRMDDLIRDSLNYSKAASEDLTLRPVDLGSLLSELVETYPNLQPDQADIDVTAKLPMVLGNEAALSQCFANLLDNAVKFTKPGIKPQIRVWAEPMGRLARIWVEDNGIGIPEHSQQRIFDLFHRGGHEQEGTGLGLAIVRKVIERMGGKVGVKSDQGKGSRFWVELCGTE